MEKLSDKLSNEYKSQMKALLGDGYSNYLEAVDGSAVRGVRINTKRISVDDFMKSSGLAQKFSKKRKNQRIAQPFKRLIFYDVN